MDKLLPRLGVLRLKDLIKAIRACKTAADERAVIAKESAFIRTSFKEENQETRHINVAKLLYIHMLGYPAHFGQMECVKLVASPRFTDKRLGYLGIMLLLDENQEVLTLVTNCLKNDMNNSNMFVVGLALCTMGNISSPEMARDLSMEVEKLLGSSNSYIRKKAALCALRIIKKVPDLMENYFARTKALLNERNHGVLLTGVTLLIEMCSTNSEFIADARQTVPTLVRHMKNLATPGHSPEHDVSGITDPFLQVKILRLMRILAKGSSETSDEMNDVLAQVATNTEASKNVGNAILYETVLTIMDIQSESSLRVLGVNILGKFLGNRDNNIRYVALTTLAKTSQTQAVDSSALQRHRSIILDCLRDSDISIRRRALDLSFYLINTQNIRILTRELLSFLEVCEGDIKSSVASRICEVAGRYRPNKRWEVDTVIRVLRVSGAWVDQSVVNTLVKLVSTGPQALQGYAVRKLYNTIKNEGEQALMQEGLLQAAVWCIGEYGELLVSGVSLACDTTADEEDGGDGSRGEGPPSEKEIVDTLSSMLRGPYATGLVKEYTVTTLVKLTSRFRDENVIGMLRTLVVKYRTHMDMELQQRAVEYTQFWTLSREQRLALLERIPVLESAEREESTKGLGSDAAPPGSVSADLLSACGASAGAHPKQDDLSLLLGGGPIQTTSTLPPSSNQKNDLLADLFGGIGLGSAAPVMATSNNIGTTQNALGDLFGSPSLLTTTAVQPSSSVATNNAFSDLFGGGDLLSSSAPPPAAAAKNYTCYSNNGLLISMTPNLANGLSNVDITSKFTNSGSSPIIGLNFQVAVPKSLKLQMLPPSNTTVAPGLTETQTMKIENPTKVPIRLRLKISYSFNGSPIDEIVTFDGFDF